MPNSSTNPEMPMSSCCVDESPSPSSSSGFCGGAVDGCSGGAGGIGSNAPCANAAPGAARARRQSNAARRATMGGERTLAAVPPKQRQIKVEQRSALASMQQLEQRSDEELQNEQK